MTTTLTADQQPIALQMTSDVSVTGGEPTADQYRIFHSYQTNDDVYSVAARRIATGKTLIYDAREVLGLND